jgi:hypothetical protein
MTNATDFGLFNDSSRDIPISQTEDVEDSKISLKNLITTIGLTRCVKMKRLTNREGNQCFP